MDTFNVEVVERVEVVELDIVEWLELIELVDTFDAEDAKRVEITELEVPVECEVVIGDATTFADATVLSPTVVPFQTT